MKKMLLCAVLIITVSVPSGFSQFRFEIGAFAPVSVGYVSDSGGDYGDTLSTIEELGILPIPNLALLLQADLGLLKLAAGIKAHSLIVYTLAYPVAQLEIALGPLSIDTSLGGYYFGYSALGNLFGLDQIDYLVPDLSVWLGLGKRDAIRLGGGALGLIPATMETDLMPFIGYAGLKVVL
jgi:hypothetical protein